MPNNSAMESKANARQRSGLGRVITLFKVETLPYRKPLTRPESGTVICALDSRYNFELEKLQLAPLTKTIPSGL
jgi:hypothetical protein